MRAIGVVDVPGHERYLRNMIAGAKGLVKRSGDERVVL